MCVIQIYLPLALATSAIPLIKYSVAQELVLRRFVTRGNPSLPSSHIGEAPPGRTRRRPRIVAGDDSAAAATEDFPVDPNQCERGRFRYGRGDIVIVTTGGIVLPVAPDPPVVIDYETRLEAIGGVPEAVRVFPRPPHPAEVRFERGVSAQGCHPRHIVRS